MSYLHCPECGLTRFTPLPIAGTCPRCRARGETVDLIVTRRLPRGDWANRGLREPGIGGRPAAS